MVRGSLWLMGVVVVTAIGGSLFWLAAARASSATAVGHASALFSSVALVTYATSLGLPIAVARYAGGANRGQTVLFNWAMVATAASSVVGAACYFPLLDRENALSSAGPVGGYAVLALLAIGLSIAGLVDVRLTAQRRLHWVMVRAFSVALLRLPLVWIRPVGSTALWLFIVAAGVPALSGVGVWLVAGQPVRGRYALRPIPSNALRAARFSLVNFVGHLLLFAPLFVLPVIVLLSVTPRQNAAFFIAWSVSSIVFLIPESIGQALLVEGGREGNLAQQCRTALIFSVACAVVLALAAAVFAPLITSFYGGEYERSVELLPTLAVAVVPWAVTVVALAGARVQHDTFATFAITGVFALMVLVPGVALVDQQGITGAGLAWLIGNCATGIIAAVWLVRRVFATADVVESRTAWTLAEAFAEEET